MSDREKLPELIDLFNSGNLRGDDLNAFVALLKNNPRLREEVRLDKELDEILANQDLLELRKKILSVQKKNKKRKGPDIQSLLLAASIVLLIGIELVLFLNKANNHPSDIGVPAGNQRSGPEHPIEDQQAEHPVINPDSVRKENKTHDRTKANQIAASFQKNPTLENMTGTTRHLGYFRMVTPVNGYCFYKKEAIRFDWTLEHPAELQLQIMNNIGTIVHESGSINVNAYSLDPGSLKRGLYYFMVTQDNRIVHVGKFLVK
jgi:hypothetical protein